MTWWRCSASSGVVVHGCASSGVVVHGYAGVVVHGCT